MRYLLPALQYVCFNGQCLISHKKGPKSHRRAPIFWSWNLHAVLLLPFQVLLPESVDSVDHLLDKFDLRVSKTVLVGDVICAPSLSTRFSTGSTGLDVKFLAACLELVNGLLGPAGKVNVDRGAHSSAKIGWAGVDVAVLLGQSKVLAALSLDGVSDGLDATGKTLKDTLDVSSLLHGDDSHLIFLIDPQKEGLGIVVEDTTSLRPVTLHTSNSKVAVSADKEEMVINKLLTDSLFHAGKRIVLSGKISGELGEGAAHQLLNIDTLLFGDSGGETESINATSNTDTSGVNGDSSLNVAGDLGSIHVGGVLGVRADSMVVLDDGIKDLGEIFVAVPVASVDAAVLVVELNGAGAGLGNGETAGGSLDVLDFVPSLLGHVLGHQRVLGLDFREFSGHCMTLWTSCRSESSNISLV